MPLERRKRGYAVLEIGAVRIGDISLVTLPGEVMLEIGQQVEASLSGKALVLGYTNGNPGYLCTERSYDEGGGTSRPVSSGRTTTRRRSRGRRGRSW